MRKESLTIGAVPVRTPDPIKKNRSCEKCNGSDIGVCVADELIGFRIHCVNKNNKKN